MSYLSEVSVIIPNFNGEIYLAECLKSLEKSITKANIKFEIILIDNGSTDNSVAVFKEFVTHTKIEYSIIQNTSNLGFAKAVNQGICQSNFNWVLLLNNDLVLSPQWFQQIIKGVNKIKHKNISTIIGTVLNKKGTRIESQGVEFYFQGKAININNGLSYGPKTSPVNKLVWGASAALVIYNKKIIKNIGMFDEDFFAYEEDIDLSLRLHNFGFKTLLISNATSFHLGGGTSNKMGNLRQRMDAKNWIFIILKNYPIKEIIFNLPKIIEERLRNLSYLIRTTINMYKFKSIYILPKDLFLTYGEVLLKIPKMLVKRFKINKLRKHLAI